MVLVVFLRGANDRWALAREQSGEAVHSASAQLMDRA